LTALSALTASNVQFNITSWSYYSMGDNAAPTATPTVPPNNTYTNATSQNLTIDATDDFSGIKNEDGTEKTGWERTLIDTQEQSFHSLMNRVSSPNYKLLNSQEYYFLPSYLDLNLMLKSKVLHYFGHTKPDIMLETIEQRLNNDI
jgi:hypothetical protein